MPATRRSTRSAAAKGASSKQSTLSFNNRVTKHSATKPTGKDLSAPAKTVDKEAAAVASAAVLTPPPTSPPTEKAEEEQLIEEEEEEEETKAVVQVEKTKQPEAEIRAGKTTDAQIKKYWKEVEAARIAKRVHQEDLSVGEKVLRYFDISSQYGVSSATAVHSFRFWWGFFFLGEKGADNFARNTALYWDHSNETLASRRATGTKPTDRGSGCSLEGGEKGPRRH